LWEVSLAIRRDFGKHGFESQHFPKRLKLFKEIFIGHTSTTTLTQNQVRLITKEMSAEEIEEMTMTTVDFPVNNANLWNLDTGGGWGGKLTIMNVDTKEYWQSDTVSDLYPGIKGRK
jgi:serine/threonine protein phosphatase 1